MDGRVRLIRSAKLIGVRLLLPGYATLLVLPGCTMAPTSQERIAMWLSDAPRTLALEVESGVPDMYVRMRDYQMQNRGAEAKKYAGEVPREAIHEKCNAVFGVLRPLDCVLTVIMTPLYAASGAIVGAFSVDSRNIDNPLSAAKGATELLEVGVVTNDISAHLTFAIVAAAKRSRHAIRSIEGSRPADWGGLTVRVKEIDLVSPDDPGGEDPEVRVEVNLSMAVHLPRDEDIWQANLAYTEGVTRRISEWRKDNAKLFREELTQEVDSLTVAAVSTLDAAPGLFTRAKVDAARQQREEARKAAAETSAGGAKVLAEPPSSSTIVPP